MIQDVKRRRGRPRGSGKPDGSTLQLVAELLAEDLRLRPTTAIKRLIGTKNDSDIRRLQVKWKAEGRTLLSQAQRRRERRRVSAAVAAPWQDPRVMKRINEMLGPWATTRLAWLESPSVKAAIDAMRPSPAMQAAIAAMRPSPAMQTMIDAMKPMQAAIDEANRWRKQFEQSLMFEAVVRKGRPRLPLVKNDE
jgi:hypothetical protein